MGDCCAALHQRLWRPGDSEEDKEHRRLLVPAYSWLGGVALAAVLAKPRPGVWSAGLALIGICGFGGLLHLLCRRGGSATVGVTYVALGSTVGLLAMDIYSASSMSARDWPYVVLVMDLLMVAGIRLRVQLAVVVMTVHSLAVVAVEEATRFGLFALVNPSGEVHDVCSCATPPCKQLPVQAVLGWISSLTVFFLDFFVTRRFAVSLRAQLQLVAATVRVSERLVQLLADYSTEEARKLIEGEGAALPSELHASYEQLLDNLDSYRVFLPDALLYGQSQQQHGARDNPHGDDTLGAGQPTAACYPVRTVAPGQGAPTADVAVCFTDIQSSTELWEAHPQAMYTGLIMHNEVMRMAYGACNGYEIKTIGDSFMLAFDAPLDAMRFGLQAQMGLLRQEWPEDLLNHPLCAPALSSGGTPLWGGLRVRIGVQYGSVRPEVSPVTGRCDYFGHTVNTAARVEAVLRKGGLVATSDSVVSALDSEVVEALGSPVLHDAGPRELKGVREPLHVWALVPRELAERVKVLQEGVETPPTPPTRSSRVSSGGLGLQRASNASWDAGVPATPRCPRSRVRKLQGSVATCAAVRLSLCGVDSLSESYQNLAAAATLAADRTQGVVHSVVSATVTVTWNTSRPCADHVGACRWFLGTPFRMPCRLGVASGQVLWGNITAGRRSFATVVGGCVDLATALAEEAERCGDTALVTGEVADSFYAMEAADWAQLWQAPGYPPIVVMAARFFEPDDLRFVGASTQGSAVAAWSNSIAGFFRQACAGEPGSPEQRQALEQLEEIGDQAAGGGAAAALAKRIRNGGVRTRAMPRLWMGGSDAQQRAPPAAIQCTEGAYSAGHTEFLAS